METNGDYDLNYEEVLKCTETQDDELSKNEKN